MSADSIQHEQSIIPENKSLAPSVVEYTQNIIASLDPSLQELAKRAIGTNFNPEHGEQVMALASNSFKEQLRYHESKDPSIMDRFTKFGVAAMIDSNKLQDVNILTSGQFGDSYVLRNIESIMTFAKEEGMDVMLGRYSGDEILTFFIPKQEISADEIMTKFSAWNRKFLAQKDPFNDKLSGLLPELQQIHGSEFELGASIEAINLKDITFNMKEDCRERELLGQVIDAIEDKLKHGQQHLSTELLDNMMTTRKLAFSFNDNPWFQEKLPDSVYKLYLDAIDKGATPDEAGAYAEDATFESLYPRMMVYRMEVFEEVTNRFRNQKDYVLIKSADPYMKWTNKYVSHSAGDKRMIGLADSDFVRVSYSATFQHHGSLLHLLPAEFLEVHDRTAERIVTSQPEADLNTDDDNPTTFRVITSTIRELDGTSSPAIITKETSSQDLWNYVDILRGEQTVNEITTLISRISLFSSAVDNFFEYLSVRINRLEEAINTASTIKPKIPEATYSQVQDVFTQLKQVSPEPAVVRQIT